MAKPLHPEHAQIPGLYHGGLSLTQIGAQLGLSAAGVRYYLLRAGVPVRSRSEGTRRRSAEAKAGALEGLKHAQALRREYGQARRAEIVRRHMDGESIPEIVTAMQANTQWVRQALMEAGRLESAAEVFREKRERIAELYASGLSLRAVGCEVGLTVGAVRSALLNAGVTPRTHQDGRHLAKPQGYRGTNAPRWAGGRYLSGDRRIFVDGEREHDGNGRLRDRLGPDALHWKGGRVLQNPKSGVCQPYMKVYSPDHPHRDRHNYVFEHRLVAEQKLGRMLTRKEVVHHVNGNRLDNRPENLEVMSRREHIRLHFSMAGLVTELKAQLDRYRELYGDLPPAV